MTVLVLPQEGVDQTMIVVIVIVVAIVITDHNLSLGVVSVQDRLLAKDGVRAMVVVWR